MSHLANNQARAQEGRRSQNNFLSKSTTLDSKATFLIDLDKVLTQGLHELTKYKDRLQMLYLQITKIMF